MAIIHHLRFITQILYCVTYNWDDCSFLYEIMTSILSNAQSSSCIEISWNFYSNFPKADKIYRFEA